MARKRKTLPKNFEDLLTAGDLDALKAVYDTCLVEARGGDPKTTALGFDNCPEELARWLVAQGLDVDTPDAWGRTPLSQRVSRGQDIALLLELGADVNAPEDFYGSALHAATNRPDLTRTLIAHGADVNVTDRSGDTPLHDAVIVNADTVAVLVEHRADTAARNEMDQTPLAAGLVACRNSDIAEFARSARILLEAGSPVPDDAAEAVTEIGRQFEFHRDDFNPDHVDETDRGLAELYALFGVQPVAARRVHDGVAPITVDDAPWPVQFDQLWEYLVPGSGAATTVQGEVIRLAGRIGHELLENGAANWDRDFGRLRDALIDHLGSGSPVTTAGELATLRGGLGRDWDDDAVGRVSELAVAWVLANPEPEPLAAPKYRR